MNHTDHVKLLARAAPQAGSIWADLGAGRGAFTLALAELLDGAGEVYAVDRDCRMLERLQHTWHARFPTLRLHLECADFTQPLDLPLLDGIVMANSLHFVAHKAPVLARVRGYLRPGGQLIMVEYNSDQGNRWVPFPFSFATWQTLAAHAGFTQTALLATHPSTFMHEFYAAASR